eukprot:CAMPEP_0183581604 /NCGR_PEP_ID=MMETSP0371-20130417/148029_1 /TAXON_ID=268820 /ORGANISM="Peridinium aciculiferum, Strain PAER-2" /LENGTH=100 /DNA_ID=CAMNT_0025792293 /DNA_START=52 /DNA_END=351 /DNA_ORIENTATION=-
MTDGTSKTFFVLQCGASGEAMGMRLEAVRPGEIILEGRVWQCRAPMAAVLEGTGFGEKAIYGRRVPVGSLELVVKMQQVWGYRPEDKAVIHKLSLECDPE